MENYLGIRKIGRGSFGEVWLVRNKRDKKQHVLKQINLQNASKRELRAANLEVQLLATLRHPNIVSYHDSFESNDGFLFIVMGYCEGGDLYGKIREQKGLNFSESQIVEWFIQISMAIQYLHERNILHRDLKTQNIFLTRSKIVKVGDLGIAKVLDGETAMATTLIGTPYYMSPELFCNRPYNYKSDVWALGCCVYELATLKHAFNARDMNALMYKIIRGKVPSMPTMYSSELLELIRGMLNHNPDKRPSVSRILRHPYIKKNISIFLEGTRLRQKNNPNANVSVHTKDLAQSTTNTAKICDTTTNNLRQAVPARPTPGPAANFHQKSPTRDRSGSNSSGNDSATSKSSGSNGGADVNPDLSVQGKRLSPDHQVNSTPSSPRNSVERANRTEQCLSIDVFVADPKVPKIPQSPRRQRAILNGDLGIKNQGDHDADKTFSDAVKTLNDGAKTSNEIAKTSNEGAKTSNDGAKTSTNEIANRFHDSSGYACGVTCGDVELCIDGQEIKLSDRLQVVGRIDVRSEVESPTKGSPDGGRLRQAKKLRAKPAKPPTDSDTDVSESVGGASSREISEALRKESEGGWSSIDEDRSESSTASAPDFPPLQTSNKENEMSVHCAQQIISSTNVSVESSENKPRVRRRRKYSPSQEVKNVFDNPVPVANHRPLPPVPQSTVHKPTVAVLPIVDASQYPRRPNSVARQRRREKLSQERDSTDSVTIELIDEASVLERGIIGDLNKLNSVDHKSTPQDETCAVDKTNCDQDMVSLIDLLNTTLKDELESPPNSVVVTPRKSQSTPTKLIHEIRNSDAVVQSRCCSRLEQRLLILENDCRKGLGQDLLNRVMAIIADRNTKEMQDELQRVMGKDKCNEFIGMLWQLKLCKESLEH